MNKIKKSNSPNEISPLLSMLSLMVLGMDTREVLALPRWCFVFFGFSSHLVVERERCLRWLPDPLLVMAVMVVLVLVDNPETAVLAPRGVLAPRENPWVLVSADKVLLFPLFSDELNWFNKRISSIAIFD